MTSYGSVLTCGYRQDGLRAWKQNSNGRTYFLYDGSMAVCELSSSGTVTATNTFGMSGLISRNTSVGSVFYDFDLTGNVAQRLTSGGAVASTDVDDAFGKRTTNDGSSDPFAFSAQWGGYTDAETGMVLLEHRYYDAAAGRWLTRDSIGYEGGVNMYAYCENQSVSGKDASGTKLLLPFDPVKFAKCLALTIGGILAICLEAIS